MELKFGYRDNFLCEIRPTGILCNERMTVEGGRAVIDARDLKHKEVNDLCRAAALNGVTDIMINNVFGQRYIGTRLYMPGADKKVDITVNRFPGNDLGAFLDGHRIVVNGNAQDGVGNTMNYGEIVVHGRAGDVVAMAMRGGKIFIRDNVGYRAAIHMKEYKQKVPVLVIGGTSQDFMGEYMAGGVVLLLGLGLKNNEPHRANHMGTGMHGGVIYMRGTVEPHQLGKEVGVRELDDHDRQVVEKYVKEYCRHFDKDPAEILNSGFIKLLPVSRRPYGNIYAY
ncbi:MAG: hypothetical protein MJA84_08070 [Firmicutes bacterium]|nr:hypothetical protein [Bacillota bacterium]